MTPATMYKRSETRSLIETFQEKGKPKATVLGWEEHYASIESCIGTFNNCIKRMGAHHIICTKEGGQVKLINTIKY